MLHLANHLVDMSSAVSDDRLTVASPYSSGQAFVSTWTLQKSRSGTYGDPTVASPKLGRLLFEKMVAETAKFIRYYEALKQV
jgi:creatinine amidohydrolase/Fe(II)-dependent formamide hydrolase-like protein